MKPTIENTTKVLKEFNFKVTRVEGEYEKRAYLKGKLIWQGESNWLEPLHETLAENAYIISACKEAGLNISKTLLEKYLRIVTSDFYHVLPPSPPPPPETPEAKEARRKYGSRELAKIKAMLNGNPQQGV